MTYKNNLKLLGEGTISFCQKSGDKINFVIRRDNGLFLLTKDTITNRFNSSVKIGYGMDCAITTNGKIFRRDKLEYETNVRNAKN